ncbi:uncharacterized protein BX664DRAFT_250793, partial [Halteromyces radiatus]|uniref:uncharacterized protein n=1 Tax=Halteromyces radiatus TaxID=101107 RepID=UPI0022208A22
GRITCPPGKVCINEICVDPPSCASHGQRCDKKGCCNGLFCHQRKLSDHPACMEKAFIGEDCSGGIPCDGTSQCIGGQCSLKIGSSCDDGGVCPYGSSCKHTNAFQLGTNKVCQ